MIKFIQWVLSLFPVQRAIRHKPGRYPEKKGTLNPWENAIQEYREQKKE